MLPTRRDSMKLMMAAVCIPWARQTNATDRSSVLFAGSPNSTVWDPWAIYHDKTFYVFALTASGQEFTNKFDAIEYWTSPDGVYWKHRGKIPGLIGDGGVWPVISPDDGRAKFVMPVARTEEKELRFAQSSDLVNWTFLGSEYDLAKDDSLYGDRFDRAIVAVPRPDGGYYGYFTATPKSRAAGIGLAKSQDGRRWEALPPAVLEDPEYPNTPREVSAVYLKDGRFYATVQGLQLLRMKLFVSDKPEGPFRPAPKNFHILPGNAAYWLRFFDTPDGVLVVHFIAETQKVDGWEPVAKRVWVAPVKLAEWDNEGTLRLKWRSANNKAKNVRIPLGNRLSETHLDPEKLIVMEGRLRTRNQPIGLYIAGGGARGTGFFVHSNGMVEWGDINDDGSSYHKRGYVDRELSVGDSMEFRLVRKGRVTEFYLNDYLMQCYSLPEFGNGRVGFLGPDECFDALKAWYCE